VGKSLKVNMSKTFGTSCVSDGCANERPRWMIMRAADGWLWAQLSVLLSLKHKLHLRSDTPHTGVLISP